ncbi:MAG: hypothetical protein ABJL72_16560 [Roseobacter sp.]
MSHFGPLLGGTWYALVGWCIALFKLTLRGSEFTGDTIKNLQTDRDSNAACNRSGISIINLPAVFDGNQAFEFVPDNLGRKLFTQSSRPRLDVRGKLIAPKTLGKKPRDPHDMIWFLACGTGRVEIALP